MMSGKRLGAALGVIGVGGALVLSGCGRKAATNENVPTPTAAGEQTTTSAEATPAPRPTEELAPSTVGEEQDVVGVTVGEVKVVGEVNLDPQMLENRRVKEEVLRRIDQFPNLSPEEKDHLYVQVDRARAMGKVITIPFTSGTRRLSADGASELGEALGLGQVRRLTEDPTVVFVVLGFADKKGDPQQNIEISRERAQSTVDVLREQFGLVNVMHAVGMGSSEMFDADNLDKNRVVEVWVVLP